MDQGNVKTVGLVEKIDPDHYKGHPSGVECIDVIEHMPSNVAAAIKYLWRADLKHPDPASDLLKASWYAAREAYRRGGISREKFDRIVEALK